MFGLQPQTSSLIFRWPARA